MSEYDDWDDQSPDDIESRSQRLILLMQSNSPKVSAGEAAKGDWLMPTGLVARQCYRAITIGCLEAWVHWGANRSGRLGIEPERPKIAVWLKAGEQRDGYPVVMKEGCYEPDGSTWEQTLYMHQLVFAVGRPLVRLDQPICGSFPFKSTAFKIGRDFYWSKLKAIQATMDGRVVRNMTLGMVEMSTERGREKSYDWAVPKPTVIGVVGQPDGPTREQANYAKGLREAFKAGQAWEAAAPPAIAGPSQSTPQAPEQSRVPPVGRLADGTPKVTSGRQLNWEQEAREPPPNDAPPPASIDDYGHASIDDEIPF